MSKELNQSVSKALVVFGVLLDDGFQGKTLAELEARVRVPRTTIWRLLKTLEAHGWVVEAPVPGTKGTSWRVSSQLAKVAHAYQRDALSRVQAVRREYRDVTGEELTHG